MKVLKTEDLREKLDDKLLAEKESTGDRARIITAVTLVLLPLVFFYPAVMGKAILAPGDGMDSDSGPSHIDRRGDQKWRSAIVESISL